MEESAGDAAADADQYVLAVEDLHQGRVAVVRQVNVLAMEYSAELLGGERVAGHVSEKAAWVDEG